MIVGYNLSMKDYYPNCHCILVDIEKPQVTVECPEEKFERYVFSPKYEYKGKKKLFLEWGYDKINTEYLVEELTRQAKEKYAKQGVRMGEVGRVLDVMNVVDNKWEVDFSGKTLLLRRDEMELVGDFDEISKQA